MKRGLELTLRSVLVLALIGSVVVQGVLAYFPWAAEEEMDQGVQVSLAIIGILGIVCLQVIAVCVWRLLTKVRRGTVFSAESFRYVDGVIASIAVGAVLVFAVAVVARFANHSTPGDEVAPGVVAFICGISLVVAGVALVVYVMRVLLAQATDLQAELREVI